jgi:hypothetical protein
MMKIMNVMLLAILAALPFSAQGAPLTKDQVKAAIKNVDPIYTTKPSKSDKRQNKFHFTGKKVRGSYTTKAISNSLCCEINSFASIGKLVLKADGTGLFRFLALTFAFDCEFAETSTFYNIPVTYTIDDPVNGVGTLTLNFSDTNSVTLYVVFKVKCGEVVGLNQLLNNDEVGNFPLWFIGDGEKDT